MSHESLALQGQLASIFRSSGRSVIGESSYVQLFKMLKALRLVRLMKLLRIAKLSSLLARYQDHFFLFAPIISILRQVAVLIFLGHLAACSFFFFSSPSWQTDVEQAMIRADDLTTWTRSERFSYALFIQPVTETSAEVVPADWVPASLQSGRAAVSDMGRLHCPRWYFAARQEGRWVCASSRGFLSRYVASLYWVRSRSAACRVLQHESRCLRHDSTRALAAWFSGDVLTGMHQTSHPRGFGDTTGVGKRAACNSW